MASNEEQYRLLEQTRMLLNPKIIQEKKRKIWEYFRIIPGVSVSNMEERMKLNTILYRAPLFKIHGSYMVNWPINNNGDDIYIDQEFVIDKTKENVINQQLTHETIHSLCRTNDRKRFGHVTSNDNEYLRGINEAATQIFTDNIENHVLEEQEDYLFFIKGVMRLISDAMGPSYLANQLLNNNTAFEEKFNEITENKFYDFAFILNDIYKLDKAKHYTSINDLESERLTRHKDIILSFTTSFVKKVGDMDITAYDRIKQDSFNKEFIEKFNIGDILPENKTK